MIAAAIVFLIEYLDDAVKSPHDINDKFDLPVIGYIGEMSKSATGDGKVYVSNAPNSSISEAFKIAKNQYRVFQCGGSSKNRPHCQSKSNRG